MYTTIRSESHSGRESSGSKVREVRTAENLQGSSSTVLQHEWEIENTEGDSGK